MSDDQRVYSDEEFALILRKATELASKAETPAVSSGTITLAEMKSAAAQVGIDPALVERAARMIIDTSNLSPLERLIGGPLQHNYEARFPVELDAERAEMLLSTVRISATVPGSKDSAHSSALGMTWHDGGELESLGVTARGDDNGTTVKVSIDRKGTAIFVLMASGVTTLMTVLFAATALYPESAALGVGGLVAGLGGIFGASRYYWTVSTKGVKERASGIMDAVARTLTKPGSDND